MTERRHIPSTFTSGVSFWRNPPPPDCSVGERWGFSYGRIVSGFPGPPAPEREVAAGDQGVGVVGAKLSFDSGSQLAHRSRLSAGVRVHPDQGSRSARRDAGGEVMA